MSNLSILCVTRVEPHARPFLDGMLELAVRLHAELVIACDGDRAMMECAFDRATIPVLFLRVDSAGYVESVLDRAVEACSRGYVLRLDDDERCSPAMVRWLGQQAYEMADHWKFPRLWLWKDVEHYVADAACCPDYQTRLSVKRMAGGRSRPHAPSPFGDGLLGAGAILHHKLLLHSLDARRALVDRYDAVEAGAGSSCRAFYVPEDCATDVATRSVSS